MAETIEKIMSIRLDEFEAGLARLARPQPVERGEGVYRLRLSDGTSAAITFTTLPVVVLGGLMRLPRAKITIRFEHASAEAAAMFIRLFDRTFQRGGG